MLNQWLTEFLPFPPMMQTEAADSDFLQVICRLTPAERANLAWPKTTTTAKAIYKILMDHSSNDPQIMYQNLATIQTYDFRPHLLLLLRGFTEAETTYHISRTLFETLHFWVQFNLSDIATPGKKDKMTFSNVTVDNAIALLKLNPTAAATFVTSTAQNAQLFTAEKIIFLINVDSGFILECAIQKLQAIKYYLARNDYEPIYLTIVEGMDFLYNVAKYFNIPALRILNNRFRFWVSMINDDTYKKELSFGLIDFDMTQIKFVIDILARKCPRYHLRKIADFDDQSHLITSLLDYDTSPILHFHYNQETHWFFLFLPPAVLANYHAAINNTPINIPYCYGKISPLELIQLRLEGNRARKGNFSPLMLTRPSQTKFVHDFAIRMIIEESLHDYYHTNILSTISHKVETIIKRWINLIGEKTGITKEGLPYSNETWRLVDSDFSSLFLAKNDIEQLHMVLKYGMGISSSRRMNIVKCMIILDILLNNYYGIVDSKKLQSYLHVQVLKRIDEFAPRFLEIYAHCQQKTTGLNVDPFIVASMLIFSILRDKDSPKFTPSKLLENVNLLTYRWDKKRDAAEKKDNNIAIISLAFNAQKYTPLETLTDVDIESFSHGSTTNNI